MKRIIAWQHLQKHRGLGERRGDEVWPRAALAVWAGQRPFLRHSLRQPPGPEPEACRARASNGVGSSRRAHVALNPPDHGSAGSFAGLDRRPGRNADEGRSA